MEKDTTFKLRLPSSELEEWEKQAALHGVSVAKWVRQRCEVHPSEVMNPVKVEKKRKEDPADEYAAQRNPGHVLGCECFGCEQTRRFWRQGNGG